MASFTITPQGPFNLLVQNQFFGGWPFVDETESAIAITFPVEGWRASATVVMKQDEQGTIAGHVYGTQGAENEAERAWQQALAALSLDVDGGRWPEVGKRDPVMAGLQNKYDYLRPILFHSPYEAAASFIIGHRITIMQARAIRQALARAIGDKIEIGEREFYAFPRPEVLQNVSEFKGLSAEKLARLHGVADSAMGGLLDRTHLRALPVEQALAELTSLRGIGQFFAQGILLRGAGLADEVSDDELTKKAVRIAYGLAAQPDQATVKRTAELWRPYRMWAVVLLHVWVRNEVGGSLKAYSQR